MAMTKNTGKKLRQLLFYENGSPLGVSHQWDVETWHQIPTQEPIFYMRIYSQKAAQLCTVRTWKILFYHTIYFHYNLGFFFRIQWKQNRIKSAARYFAFPQIFFLLCSIIMAKCWNEARCTHLLCFIYFNATALTQAIMKLSGLNGFVFVYWCGAVM